MAKQSKLLVDSVPPSDVGNWQARLRNALFDAVTETDVTEIAKSLVDKAKGGDLGATRLLFSYVLGGTSVKVNQAVFLPPNCSGSVNGNEVGYSTGYSDGSVHALPKPTAAVPGSPDKIEEMSRRFARGEQLHNPRDKSFGSLD